MNRTSFEPDFEVTVITAAADGPVITVRGELDSAGCDELMAVFHSLETGVPKITLDLSGVSFIDSAGTRAVIMLEREARDQGMSLAVSAPPNEVTELLRTAGVIDHFQLRPGASHVPVDTLSVLERVELDLPLDPRSPARARAEIRELMQGRDQTQTGDAVLLTSEIVTNAVIHPTMASGESIGLRIFTYEEGIRVEVEDSGEGFDPTLLSSPGPEGGRGLFLVDRFASGWGTECVENDRGQRFLVWFELDWRQPRSLEPAPE